MVFGDLWFTMSPCFAIVVIPPVGSFRLSVPCSKLLESSELGSVAVGNYEECKEAEWSRIMEPRTQSRAGVVSHASALVDS